MPTYDYKCRKCGKKFSIVMTVADYEKRRPKCPKCKSTKIEQQLHSFFAVTSKKS